MIKVTQRIRIYEVNGQELGIGERQQLGIDSHDIRNTRVVIITPSGAEYGVLAQDLIMAAKNAQNTGGTV